MREDTNWLTEGILVKFLLGSCHNSDIDFDLQGLKWGKTEISDLTERPNNIIRLLGNNLQ